MRSKYTCIEIATVWNSNIKLLTSRFADFPKHKISHDTVRRLIKLVGRFKKWSILQLFTENIISKIDELKDTSNQKYTNNDYKIFNKKIVPFDGKAFRASRVKKGSEMPRYILNAFDNNREVVLEISLVGDKTNEIKHTTELLKKIDVSDCVITTDALNSTRKFSKEIINSRADYCFAIKENYKGLYANVRDLFIKYEESELVKHAKSRNHEHDRIEDREVYVLPAYLLEEEYHERYAGLRHGCIVMNPQKRHEKNKDKKTFDNRYFIVSLSYEEKYIAEFLMHVIRSHWGVENKYHHILDVSFNQDRFQCKNADFILGESILQVIATNLASGLKTQAEVLEKKEIFTPEAKASVDSLDSFINAFYTFSGTDFARDMGIIDSNSESKD